VGRSTTGEPTSWRREQRSSDGDELAEPSILQAPVDGLAAPPRAHRCVPPRRGGAASSRQAIGGEGRIGIGEEERQAIGWAAARVSLRAASFICHNEQKNGRPRFAARKIRWLRSPNRCEAPVEGHHIYPWIAGTSRFLPVLPFPVFHYDVVHYLIN
jgi:hypothetical protein